MTTGQPEYLADKLVLRRPEVGRIFPNRHVHTIQTNCTLTVARSGFLYKGAKLWNCLPLELRQETKSEVFKAEVKKWVREQISRKPP
jgi:hypothetical protein